MAEPISIIGLVAAALKGVAQTADFIENIRRAPATVETLSEDLRTIEGLLWEFDRSIRGFDESTRTMATGMMRDSLASCERLTKKADALLKPFVRVDNTPGMTVWKRFTFTFKEADVEFLQRDLSSCKQSLILAISCITLIAAQKQASAAEKRDEKQGRRLKRIQRHVGAPSSADSEDIHTRNGDPDVAKVEKWLVDTETIVEEEEEQETGVMEGIPHRPRTPADIYSMPGTFLTIEAGTAGSQSRVRPVPTRPVQVNPPKNETRPVESPGPSVPRVTPATESEPSTNAPITEASRPAPKPAHLAPASPAERQETASAATLEPAPSWPPKRQRFPRLPSSRTPGTPAAYCYSELSKGRVSREALLEHGIWFKEGDPRDSHVKLADRVDSATVGRLYDLSWRLEPDRNLWW